jgi:hypothetical protein
MDIRGYVRVYYDGRMAICAGEIKSGTGRLDGIGQLLKLLFYNCMWRPKFCLIT